MSYSQQYDLVECVTSGGDNSEIGCEEGRDERWCTSRPERSSDVVERVGVDLASLSVDQKGGNCRECASSGDDEIDAGFIRRRDGERDVEFCCCS